MRISERRRPQQLCALLAGLLLALAPAFSAKAQVDSTGSKPFFIDVNKIHWNLTPGLGDGGMTSQFSWNTVARKEATEPFYYPADRWYGNMLFQLWNILNLSDSGYVNLEGERQLRKWRIASGDTEWSIERRRYRPANIVVDGIQVNPPYIWEVDPTLTSDYHGTFVDIFRNPDTGYGGMRSKIDIWAFANPNHQDYVIWKETRTFTGETRLTREYEAEPSREDYLPDQTIKLWWTFVAGFGPSKGGERSSWKFFVYEGEDDKENYFKRTSELVTDRARKELTVAYFWDDMSDQSPPYALVMPDGTTSPRDDDAGDPNRINGGLTATQIPGFTVLYADKSGQEHVDDPTQPVAAPRGNINDNFFSQQDKFIQRDIWAGLNAPWPGPPAKVQKGAMRGLATGPYTLTMERDENANLVRADSFTVVYAIGVGDVGYQFADSLGKAWFRGDITDAEKRVFIEMGRDSLFRNLDRAYWAWDHDLKVPAPLPPPDIEVNSGPGYNEVNWSYPEERYWLDPHTGVNDFYAWRVYRKTGGFWVNDPNDDFAGFQWELVHETTNPQEQSWQDDTVQRGASYYYAVTAVDDGSQNTFGLFPGQKLESSRYENASQAPAISFQPGLDVTNLVRAVPNPATGARGALGFPGNPDKILFVNLPYEATLSIYTENGELIKRMEHTASADETWNQRTEANQYVASGIYILAVHNARDAAGNGLPDQFVKFVIIR